jgi:MFS family permease
MTILLRPFSGWTLDRFGRKPCLVAGLLLFCCSRFMFIFSDSILRLYFARSVAGISSAFLSVAFITIISDLSEPANRGGKMGKSNEKVIRSNIIGIFFGIFLYHRLPAAIAWQTAFFGYSAMAVIALWTAGLKMPETQPVVQKIFGSEEEKSTISVRLIKLLCLVSMTSISGALLIPIYLIYLQDKFTEDFGDLMLVFLPGALAVAFLAAHLESLSDRFGRTRSKQWPKNRSFACRGIRPLWYPGLYLLPWAKRAI